MSGSGASLSTGPEPGERAPKQGAPERRPRHYVIVVHGIGEQRINETAVDVIHRFAEIRQPQLPPHLRVLLPPHLSAQTGRGKSEGYHWIEFDGIPVDPADPTGPFDGTLATRTSGRNFRFVDLYWADILRRHQEDFAVPPERWGPALVARLDAFAPAGLYPAWAGKLLEAVVNGLLPLKKVLALKYPDAVKTIFEGFLGDVHLYGDCARTRGEAVRRFHAVLDEIHLRDFIDWCSRDVRAVGAGGAPTPYEPPTYTVIAHSLGSIMSFDALVYAFASESVRAASFAADHPCRSLPFPGYSTPGEGEEESWSALVARTNATGRIGELGPDAAWRIERRSGVPPLLWRDHVRRFVTLGSPIDKYLVLWWQNYFHMGLKTHDGEPATPEAWEDCAKGWLEPPAERIVHYNLCDEQDPVGHHLDVAASTEVYPRIFDAGVPVYYRDVVFRRYSAPGAAHVKYWEDGDLFRGIIREVIEEGRYFSCEEREAIGRAKESAREEHKGDPKKTQDLAMNRGYFLTRPFRDEDGSVYAKALEWAYFRIPLIAALLTALLLVYGGAGIVYGDVTIWRFAAIVAAGLLWRCPNPTEAYVEETRPGTENGRWLWVRRWKLRRGILAHLVRSMIIWRRVLIELNGETSACTHGCGRENDGARKPTDLCACVACGDRLVFPSGGGFLLPALIRVDVWALMLLMALANYVHTPWEPVRRFALVVSVIAATYLAVMAYVISVFRRAKWQVGKRRAEAGRV